MNFRTTAVLLVLLAAIGGYAYFYGRGAPPPSPEKPPYVYSVQLEDIVKMDVTYRGQKVELVYDADKKEWNFADPSKGKVDQGRVNGIRLLLTGPGSKRVLFKGKVENLVDFGLDRPQTIASISLKDGSTHSVLIGEKTPNGESYYIKNQDDNDIYLVDFTWGNEIARFVAEPPVEKGTT